MPGIAGVVFPDAFQVDRLTETMLHALAHRGPPTWEATLYKNIQVGITGGTHFAWQDIVVGLDGNLFGTDSLRKDLEEKGYPAEKATDSALISYAYHLWGIECLEKIDGDFAFFILDKNKSRLFLVRDRIGKKPLYWYHDNRYLFFASELKGILANHIVPQVPALDAFASYLYFGYIPQDQTPVQGINKLLPGYYLQCNKDHSTTIKAYWSYSSCFLKHSNEASNNEAIFDKMLQKSVRERLPDASPVGCFISGGLGSASIAYYLQKAIPSDQIRAFTVGFSDETTADMKAAAEISQVFGIQQKELNISPKAMLDDLVKIAWYLDEPLADPNVIGTWQLASIASQTQVVFSGMGSDELLAGHNRYTIEEQKKKGLTWGSNSFASLKQFLLPFLSIFTRQYALQILQKSQIKPLQVDYLNQNALFDSDLMKKVSPELSKLFDVYGFLHKFFNIGRIPSTVGSYLYLDVKTRLPDCFMLQYERLTSAHQLDWRAPYLTQYIVEFLASLPEPEELSSLDSNWLLKKILRNELPKDVLDRPKKSRPQLLQLWEEISGVGKLFQTLPNGLLVEHNLISKKWLQNQVSTPELRKEGFSKLWSLLMLEIWMRLYINKPVSSTPPELTVHELIMET